MRGQLTPAIVFITLLFSVGCNASLPTDPPPGFLEELRDIEELQTRFNQDDGAIRLVLLLSPT